MRLIAHRFGARFVVERVEMRVAGNVKNPIGDDRGGVNLGSEIRFADHFLLLLAWGTRNSPSSSPTYTLPSATKVEPHT